MAAWDWLSDVYVALGRTRMTGGGHSLLCVGRPGQRAQETATWLSEQQPGSGNFARAAATYLWAANCSLLSALRRMQQAVMRG